MSVVIKMAFRNVLRNWRHSMATLASIALGLVGVSLVDGFIKDLETQSADYVVRRNMHGHILIESSSESDGDIWSGLMSGADVEAIDSVLAGFPDQITARSHFLPLQGIVEGSDNSVGFIGYAYDVEEGEKIRGPQWQRNTIYGEPLKSSGESKILVGRGLAELLGCSFTGIKAHGVDVNPEANNLPCLSQSLQLTSLTENGKINAWDAEIKGVVEIGFRDLEDSWLLMPIEQARQFLRTQKTSMIGIALSDIGQRAAVVSKLQESFAQLKLPVRVLNWEDHKDAEFHKVNMAVSHLFRNFVLLIVIVVCSLALTNTMTRSVIQRTREIGTLRAIGFKQRFIYSIFTVEGFLLGFLGALLGTALSILITTAINAARLSYIPGFSSQPVLLQIEVGSLLYSQLILIQTLTSGCLAWVVSILRTRQGIAESLLNS
jgi:putative ABC transport system permease protein